MILPGRAAIRALIFGASGAVLLSEACTGGTQDHDRLQVRGADCIVCHSDDVQHALNPPHEGFPDSCGTCHGQEAWSPAAFMHTWPLVGAHAMLACALATSAIHRSTKARPHSASAATRSDYDSSPYPGHADFPTTCENCHTTTAWTPAVGGTHPENAFPIQNGAHSPYRDDCVSCHNPDLGSPVNGENADCVGCHDGEHTRASMDPKHLEEPDYPQGAAPPNFCLDCHSDGRN